MRYSIINIIAVTAIVLTVSLFSGCHKNGQKEVRIIVTTDVHGNIFTDDLVSGKELSSSMSKVSSYIRSSSPYPTLILDNGDNLQGSPSVYYYNFEDTVSPHLWAEVLNWLGYDAVTAGNHDIEAGHNVYDRLRDQYMFPMLAANAVSVSTGKPYFEPYTIIRKGGLKIAVMGLITPGVPGWLPEVLYRGIRFDDMVETASLWMPEILKEKPDIVIGLFHAGWDEEYGPGSAGSYRNENASLAVARQVPGFDLIFIGHDHDLTKKSVLTVDGDTVIVLDGGSHARSIAVADIKVSGKGAGAEIDIDGRLVKTDTLPTDKDFTETFSSQYIDVHDYVNRPIGTLTGDISSRESFFGDSPFMDLIHTVQLQASGADISFAAPLSYDVTITEGTVLVKDMFDLYRYENMLYTIELSGSEIDSYLEYSYSLWTEQMNSPESYMLKYDFTDGAQRLKNRYYNFDSAEGIIYEVDVRMPDGEKVNIISMSDGESFEMDKMYRVALNSYRGSGGGGHLKAGCGLNDKDILSRLLSSTDKDLRFFMIKWIEEHGNIRTDCSGNWKFIPDFWVKQAGERESERLFSK